MNKAILVTHTIPSRARELLEEKGYTVDMNEGRGLLTQKQLLKLLQKKSYDAVITLLTDPIDAVIFKSCPSVKLYVNYATGFDNFNIQEARTYGVTLANAPAVSSAEAVAEHTIALMLALAARIVEADSFVRKGKYAGWDPMNFIGTDVLGKTILLVGVGRIGSKVAQYASGLGLSVIYTDVVRNTEIEEKYKAVYYASLYEALPLADIVSVHVPLLPTTKHLFNEQCFPLCKPTAFLVNTSRGPVIDEQALVKALKNKVLAGAALDVFEFEPLVSKGLTKLPNVILTPHIASASSAARNEMAEVAALNIIDFFEGKTPRNIIKE